VSDPVLVSIAASLAGKAVASVYDAVRRKFAQTSDAAAVLDAAEDAASDSPEVQALSEQLAKAEDSDPEFGAELRALWRRESVKQRADRGGVTNQISGSIGGKVVQARDVQGGISF
jgi:hypothetical protein